LVVIRLVPPLFAVLDAITDHQEQTGILRGDDQLVQQTKSNGIVPVKVLDDHDDRLRTTLAQQQSDDCVIGALPMLERVEGPEGMLVFERIEEIQQRRDRVVQCGGERQNPARHFLPDRLRAVMDVDLEIILEQLDGGQVGRRVTIRSRAGLQDQPVRQRGRTNKLVHQARLPHPRFADDRHYLTATLAGKLLRTEEPLELVVAADEACQATPGGGLQARSRGAHSGHLVDLYRIGEPLNRHRAERLHGDIAFG
jgi:hypothetical protein